jgi:hypothetical protein
MMPLEQFPAMTNLSSVINQLERERTRLTSQLEKSQQRTLGAEREGRIA